MSGLLTIKLLEEIRLNDSARKRERSIIDARVVRYNGAQSDQSLSEEARKTGFEINRYCPSLVFIKGYAGFFLKTCPL